MKNKIIAIVLSLALIMSLAGCNYDSVQIEDSHNYGNFTLLVNADGTPMIYSN